MTTPNFGWPLPADTDAVRDGAAAIRALGDAVDGTVDGIDGRVTTAEGDITALEAITHGIGPNVAFDENATSISNTTATFASVGVSVTITPSSSTSGLLIVPTVFYDLLANADRATIGQFALARTIGATLTTVITSDVYHFTVKSPDGRRRDSTTFPVLDFPGTTDPVTYDLRFRTASTGQGRVVTVNTFTPSTLFVAEVAG